MNRIPLQLILYIDFSFVSIFVYINEIKCKNKFIAGLVTDGDLRRELNKNSLNNNLKNFTNKSPLTVNENMPASKALKLMNEKKITSLLVVSDKDLRKKNKILKGIIHIHILLQKGVG